MTTAASITVTTDAFRMSRAQEESWELELQQERGEIFRRRPKNSKRRGSAGTAGRDCSTGDGGSRFACDPGKGPLGPEFLLLLALCTLTSTDDYVFSKGKHSLMFLLHLICSYETGSTAKAFFIKKGKNECTGSIFHNSSLRDLVLYAVPPGKILRGEISLRNIACRRVTLLSR